MAEEQEGISREAALFLTWLRLQEHEAANPGQPYATVLEMRQSRFSIDDLAQQLSAKVGSPVSPEMFRKTLQKARRKFLELITELGHPPPWRRSS